MYSPSHDMPRMALDPEHPPPPSPPSRCLSSAFGRRSPCRQPSCSNVCRCPASATHRTRKFVSFDRRSQRLGGRLSVNRESFRGNYSNGGSFYRNISSPTPSRPAGSKTMEYANLSMLLRKLSILQLEMRGLLHGRNVRERVQLMGQKMDDEIQFAERSPTVDGRWVLEDQRKAKFHHQRKELVSKSSKAARKGKQVCIWGKQENGSAAASATMETAEGKRGEDADKDEGDESSEGNSDIELKERKQIVQLWHEYNCDLHLRRIIDGSRKDAAIKVLEKVVHSRLTFYMLQYISSVAKGLIGDEKTHYLSFFKTGGPFRSKPLNEGTYCELLSFVGKQIHPARDVLKALEVSEDGLEEEGGRAGFNPNAIGDIRAQMRVFIAVAGSSAIAPNTMAVSQLDNDDDLFTAGSLQDLIHAADQGRLGALQNAQQLIKLACFLALKQLDLSFLG